MNVTASLSDHEAPRWIDRIADHLSGRISHLWSGLAQRAHLPHTPWHLPGFRFAETMSGTAILNGQQRNMVFRLTAEAPTLLEYLRTGRTHIAGQITIDHLVHQAPLQGELWIRPLSRLIRYEFSFRDDKGRLLRFAGQKDLRLLRLPQTLRTLPGQVRDEHGQSVADAKLRFRARDLPAFLGSFRALF